MLQLLGEDVIVDWLCTQISMIFDIDLAGEKVLKCLLTLGSFKAPTAAPARPKIYKPTEASCKFTDLTP